MEEGPWDVAQVAQKLQENPPDASLRRIPLSEKPDPTPPTIGPIPTLDELEEAIRRTTDKDEAERLSKQVRSLKAMQDVREQEGRTIDASQARREIEAAFTLFQTTMIGWPKSIAATLVGLAAGELETILEGKFVELLAELRRKLEHAITPDAKTFQRDEPGLDTAGEVAAESVG